MPAEPAKTTATIIPCLRYANAHAAIQWLCTAFGFQKRAVYGDEKTVHHAELTFGNGMIMLGSNVESEFGKLTALTSEVGGRGTQSPYIIVADADSHHAQAVAHGAKVVIPLKTEDYGGRGYSCLDLEGNLWTFGTYDPWTVPPQK